LNLTLRLDITETIYYRRSLRTAVWKLITVTVCPILMVDTMHLCGFRILEPLTFGFITEQPGMTEIYEHVTLKVHVWLHANVSPPIRNSFAVLITAHRTTYHSFVLGRLFVALYLTVNCLALSSCYLEYAALWWRVSFEYYRR